MTLPCFDNRLYLVIILLFCNVLCFSQFAGGEGSEGNPYQIETPVHLDNIRNHLSDDSRYLHFIQIADIDLDVPPWNEGEGWDPIGYLDREPWPFDEAFFKGTYDGDGHIITGLTINRPRCNDDGGVGLFNRIEAATIRNLGLNDVNIIGNRNVGAFTGYMGDGSLIENCYVSGRVNGYSYIGGITGYLREGYVYNTYSTAGITGRRAGSTLTFIGGIAGRMWSDCEIKRCYVTGMVESPETVNVGALIGNQREEEGVEHVHWNTDATGQERGIGDGEDIPGHASSHFQLAATFGGFDFENVWNIVEEETFPFLQWQGDEPDDHNYPPLLPPRDVFALEGDTIVDIYWREPNEEENTDGYNIYRNGNIVNDELIQQLQYHDTELANWETYIYTITAVFGDMESMHSKSVSVIPVPQLFGGGRGTADDPWIINHERHLHAIRHLLGAEFSDMHFKQRAHLDLDTEPWNVGEGWEPIGGGNDEPFFGNYNGNGYRISGLTIDRSANDQGLFGRSDGTATFYDIELVDVDVDAGFGVNVGALVGWHLGRNDIVKVKVCGDVEGREMVGGITGRTTSSAIRYSYTLGSVTANNWWVGGIAGLCSGLYDSFSRMDVTGFDNHIGGLVGRHSNELVRCYYAGTITVNADEPGSVGGLVGSNRSDDVVDSYWCVETSGQAASVGGGTPVQNAADMIYEYGEGVYEGFDFEEEPVWAHDAAQEFNEGYPILWYQDVVVPDTPVVSINAVTVDDEDYILISWEEVDNATSYIIYTSENPYVDQYEWQRLTVTAETEYVLPVEEYEKSFFYVTASSAHP